ncbi:MAG TPA: hypothetical protein VGE27_18980 [Gemmatimonas sp.]|uniref:hypothetical protein n=1 Tax=Gemmatimonas sp. TaxID=1962908 RepID=UPI002ED8846E
MKRTRALLAALLAMPVAVACFSDPLGPDLIIDPVQPLRLSAVSANGQTLPASVVVSAGSSQGHVFNAAQLLITAPDSLRVVIATRPAGYMGAALWLDTLRARIQSTDDAIIISQLDANPLVFDPRASLTPDGSLVLTLRDVTVSSDSSTISTPVSLLFAR